MSRWVILGLWIISYVRIGIHPTRVGLRGVSSHKAATHRVIVAEVVVEQPCLASEPLPGVSFSVRQYRAKAAHTDRVPARLG